MRKLSITVALAASLAVTSQAGAKPGDLYVGVPGSTTSPARVVRVNPKTGAQHAVVSGHTLDSPDGGDFTKSGKLLIADYGVDAVFKVNVKTGKVREIASGPAFHGPTDVTVDPGGNVYAVDPFAGADGQGAIFRISGGQPHLVSEGGFFAGGPLGLDFAHHRIYTEDQDAGPGETGALLSVKPSTGQQHIISSGDHLSGGYGMTLAPNTKVAYISDDINDSVVRIRLSSGRQHVVAAGPPINGPTGVAVGLDGKLYVTNDANAKIIRVNPKTGKTSVVSKGHLLKPGGEGITVQPR